MKKSSETNENAIPDFADTSSFPLSLSESFDGTREIPYAPDLRPELPLGQMQRRKAAKRPGNFAKQMPNPELPDEEEEDPFEDEMPIPPIEIIEEPKFIFDALSDSSADQTVLPEINEEETDPFAIDLPIQLEQEPDLVYPPEAAFVPEEAERFSTEGAKKTGKPKTKPASPSAHKESDSTSDKWKGTFAILPVIVGVGIMVCLLYFMWPQLKNAIFGEQEPETSSSDVSSTVVSSESGNSDTVSSRNAESSDIPSVSSGMTNAEITYSSQTYTKEYTDKEKPVFSIEIEEPVLSIPGNPLAEKKINAALSGIYEELIGETERMAAEFADNRAQSETPRTDELPGSYHSLFQLIQTEPQIITIMDCADIYNGGASNYKTVKCYHFRAESGETVTLDDYITDRAALAEIVIDRIESDDALLALVHQSIYAKYVRENLCDEWYLSGNGLVLLYQQYNIGPGASDTIEIILPPESYQSLLAEAYRG